MLNISSPYTYLLFLKLTFLKLLSLTILLFSSQNHMLTICINNLEVHYLTLIFIRSHIY